jgi:proline utilization trans-activator
MDGISRIAQCTWLSLNRYVEDLLKENERLRAASIQLDTVAAPDPPFQALQGPSSTRDIAATQDNLQYPLLEDRPWFHPISSLDMPIHISEAADASFATRFRQTLGNVHTNHIPRMSYVTDERLLLLSDQECPWPTSARARFLVKVALNTFCRYYHIVRRSIVLENLELAIKNQGRGDRLHICRLLALFALGELYSTKTAARDGSFPGLDYFARATKMAGVPAERPRMDAIEIILLLVVYSYAMNRRHSAYSFSTSAIRLGTIMGMHLNIPDQQYGDRQAREHRIRVWWTAYILDRTCASKVGLPVSIREDTIHVDLPNSGDFGDDFGDAEYMLRSIELAKLAAQSIRSIYSRRKHESSFSQRVQLSLKDFTRWMESLPHHLQIGERNAASVSPHNVLYLHLTFNQVHTCSSLLIADPLTTIVRHSRNSTYSTPHPPLP